MKGSETDEPLDRKASIQSVHCPTCSKELLLTQIRHVPTFPFCSERCQLLDLGKWIEEEYRISEPLTPNGLETGLSGDGEGEDQDEED